MNGERPGGYAVNDLHSVKEKLGDTITVRQLLSHTSGLPDNFFEPATAGDHVGLSVCDLWLQVLLNPGGKGATKQWSPNDIIADCFKSGLPAKAKFSPGSGGIIHTLRWLLLRDYVPPMPHCSSKIAIVGHTPRPDVLDLGYLKCLDTNCCYGGWLTALDVDSGQLWQVDEKGEVRV